MSIKQTAIATLTACAVLISSPVMAQETKVVKTFSAWTLYSHTGAPGDGKIYVMPMLDAARGSA